MTDVSFVVPAWNEARRIRATLAALRESGEALAPLAWEVVVVDNASDDGTAPIALAGGARVVPEPVRGIARARNAGARAASGRLLVFVDADTRVSPGLVRKAVRAMEAGRAAGGGSVIRFADGSRAARLAAGIWNLISRKSGWAAGCFLFCRKEAWEAVGGFDEGVYASEEIRFSRAVKRWGRERGLGFSILSGDPPTTSGRKIEGAAWAAALLQCLLLMVCPWLVRSRRACFLWYRR